MLGYDGRGNLTTSGTSTYSYNADNLMISAPGGVTMGWDPLGRMAQIASGSSTTRFGYDGINLIAEYNAANALTRRYVHGPGTDDPIVWYEGAGTSDRRFLMADERGSIVSVTNASGAILASPKEEKVPVMDRDELLKARQLAVSAHALLPFGDGEHNCGHVKSKQHFSVCCRGVAGTAFRRFGAKLRIATLARGMVGWPARLTTTRLYFKIPCYSLFPASFQGICLFGSGCLVGPHVRKPKDFGALHVCQRMNATHVVHAKTGNPVRREQGMPNPLTGKRQLRNREWRASLASRGSYARPPDGHEWGVGTQPLCMARTTRRHQNFAPERAIRATMYLICSFRAGRPAL